MNTFLVGTKGAFMFSLYTPVHIIVKKIGNLRDNEMPFIRLRLGTLCIQYEALILAHKAL